MLINTLGLAVRGAGLGRLARKRVWNDLQTVRFGSSFSSGSLLSSKARLVLKTTSSVALFGAVGVGIGGAFSFNTQADQSLIQSLLDWLSSNLIKKAACEVQIDRTIQETDNENGKKSDAFDWTEFYKLIKEEKWYFLAAIVVNRPSYPSSSSFLFEFK